MLGKGKSRVQLTTTGGSLNLVPASAVSPSLGNASLAIPGGETVKFQIEAGDAIVYETDGKNFNPQRVALSFPVKRPRKDP